MKRIILSLLICGLNVAGFAQMLSGEYSNDGKSTGSYYTKIKWEVSYSFVEKNDLFYIKFYNPKITVPNYSLYHDEFGKEYSLADLDLATWPNVRQLPFAMSVKANVSDGYKNYEVTASCNADFTCGDTYIASKANLKNVTIQNFRVTGVTYFRANLGGEPAVDNILKNKRQSGEKSSTTSNVSANGAEFPANTSGTPSDNKSNVNSAATRQSESSAGRTTTQNSTTDKPWTRSQVNEYLERGAASRRAQERVITQKTEATMNVINAVGNYFVDKAEQKRVADERAFEAEFAAEEEKIAQLKAENAQREQFRANRTALITSFNGGKVPLSSQKVTVDEIYFFCFSYDHAAIENPDMKMYVSNVFPIARYSDGTWPFTTTLLDNIARANNGAKAELSGFYTSQQDAEQKSQEFLEGINDLSLTQGVLTYKGKKDSGSESTDFWGNPKSPEKQSEVKVAEKKSETESKVETDFWGNPVKTEVKKADATDFFGEPIKQESKKTTTAPKNKTGKKN